MWSVVHTGSKLRNQLLLSKLWLQHSPWDHASASYSLWQENWRDVTPSICSCCPFCNARVHLQRIAFVVLFLICCIVASQGADLDGIDTDVFLPNSGSIESDNTVSCFAAIYPYSTWQPSINSSARQPSSSPVPPYVEGAINFAIFNYGSNVIQAPWTLGVYNPYYTQVLQVSSHGQLNCFLFCIWYIPYQMACKHSAFVWFCASLCEQLSNSANRVMQPYSISKASMSCWGMGLNSTGRKAFSRDMPLILLVDTVTRFASFDWKPSSQHLWRCEEREGIAW